MDTDPETELPDLTIDSELPTDILPRSCDVIRYSHHLLTRSKLNARNYPLKDLASDVSQDVFNIWTSLCPSLEPYLSKLSDIKTRIFRLLEKAQTILKKKGKSSALTDFQKKSLDIFDLLRCR